jgi:type I restriction enzyme S subunit
VVTPLSELLTGIETGKSFQCEERPPVAGEVGVVKVSAVSWGEYREQESKTCTTAERVNADYFIQPGDFLFSRANTIELVGACVVARQVTLRVMLSDKILRLQFLWDDLKPWMLYFLGSKAGRLQIETLASGNQESMRNIGQERLGQILVPLPPQAERTRIVAKLEELLSELDAGVAELKAAQAKLQQYRQSLLKAAVEGALTAEWRERNPPQETGAELLARILRERRARWEVRQLARFKAQGKAAPKGWQSKYGDRGAPDTSQLPLLPAGWVYASIGQCFEVSVGATPSRKVADYWGGDVPWVSSGEVRFNHISKTREAITEQGLANSSTQINPAGSVLLGMIGEGKTRGQVAILDIDAANNQNCAAIWVPETDVPPEFIYCWLWSRYDETRRGSSGNNQPALNKSLVEAMPMPLAPVAEMREVVERLSAQLSGIEAQEREIGHLLRLAAAQRQNILRAAFAGQLVPQDPADEPASALLARIRAERAQRPAAAKRMRRSPPQPATP